MTMKHEVGLENVMGSGDRWTLSGGQWGAWNATYGPRGADGKPVVVWDPKTGAIDRSVVEHWKKYDLRLTLEQNWSVLAPKLKDKIHIWVGDADNYFLNNAVIPATAVHGVLFCRHHGADRGCLRRGVGGMVPADAAGAVGAQSGALARVSGAGRYA